MTENCSHREPDGVRPNLRLAVISTPRSGNTWVRMQLATLYGLEQIPVHFPTEVDWDNLPRRCVIQIHWYPIEPFLGYLGSHGVQVVVLARHPFDVLISWLNLAYYKHKDGICPGDGACTECAIAGASPRSEVFRDYACGEYGRVLLCHSPAWWERPGVIRARYEDLLAAPEVGLGRLAEQIGEAPLRPISEVVAAHTIRQMRTDPEVWRFHCWQGQAGLWRHLIPAEQARAIAASVPEAFDVLGYPCDPDESLTPLQADHNWARVQLDATRDYLDRERAKQRKAERAISALTDDVERIRQALRDEQQAHDETRRALDSTRARLDAAAVHPSGVGRRLSRIATRVPGVSRFVRPGHRSHSPYGAARHGAGYDAPAGLADLNAPSD
jgi:hypothetical protein